MVSTESAYAQKTFPRWESSSRHELLIAFPLVLPMGWKNSPPYFCALTETVADVTNEYIQRHLWPPRHRLDRVT